MSFFPTPSQPSLHHDTDIDSSNKTFFTMPVTPPLTELSWTTPDPLFSDAIALNWSTPLSPANMSGATSNKSSPVDFAFEAPGSAGDAGYQSAFHRPDPIKTPSYTPNSYTPSSGPLSSGGSYNFNVNNAGYSSASSFSSAGSVTGSSFSSADALPAISRDFVRPSETETRRPATAGAALQGRSSFATFSGQGDRFQKAIPRTTLIESQPLPQMIEEAAEGIFNNPFASPPSIEKAATPQTVPPAVDPRFVSPGRRASEPQHGNAEQYTYPTGRANVNGFPMQTPPQPVYQPSLNLMQQFGRNLVGRPQTSDGLPSYAQTGISQVPLPSTKFIVNQIDGYAPTPNYFASSMVSQTQDRTVSTASLMPFRDSRIASMGSLPSQPNGNYPGSRAYSLGDTRTTPLSMRPSCITPPSSGRTDASSSSIEPSELTFVPLGGPAQKKRPRRRFDEIERLYRCGFHGCDKSYGTLNHLNAHVAMQKHGEKRLPTEFKDMRKAWRKKKRDQVAASADPYAGPGQSSWNRGSMSSSDSGEYDRRQSTASSATVPDYTGRSAIPAYPAQASTYGWDNRPNTSGSMSSVDTRPGYAYPSYNHTVVGAVSSNANVNPNPIPNPNLARRPSAPQHLPMPQQPILQGFRQQEGDHLTPTQQNPYPVTLPPTMRANYPFQTLTSAVPAGSQGYGGQFAFR